MPPLTEKVDLVIFAGDAYRDRSPAPTFQREWGKRIIRLSKAGIRTLLLVGNHDLSPALGRANAIQEFETLEIPACQRALASPNSFPPDELGLPVQVIAIPWVSRSGLMAADGCQHRRCCRSLLRNIEGRLTELVQSVARTSRSVHLPIILTAHASVQGAKYGSERTVMLGADLVLPGSLVRDPRLDYVALGHIHKPQNLNENAHPPVIYPGSIERVDFGEAADDKFFVIADIIRGRSGVHWRKLEHIRPFIDRQVSLRSPEKVTETLQGCPCHLPKTWQGAIIRLTVDYDRQWDALIDEPALRVSYRSPLSNSTSSNCLISTPAFACPAVRLPAVSAPLELLDQYWRRQSHRCRLKPKCFKRWQKTSLNRSRKCVGSISPLTLTMPCFPAAG